MNLQKQKPVRSKKYLDWIKVLPCIICFKPNAEPHHIPKDGNSGKGTKTDDIRAIPLCHIHHVEYHNNGKQSFAQKYNLNYEYIIERLNKIWEKKAG